MNSTTSSNVLKGAVVHVQRRFRNAAEGRRLEHALVLLRSGHSKATKVLLHRTHLRHTEIMKLVIREVRPVMANDTAGFSFEQYQASNRRVIHGLRVTSHIFIESRIGGEHRALIGRNRRGNVLQIDSDPKTVRNCC